MGGLRWGKGEEGSIGVVVALPISAFISKYGIDDRKLSNCDPERRIGNLHSQGHVYCLVGWENRYRDRVEYFLPGWRVWRMSCNIALGVCICTKREPTLLSFRDSNYIEEGNA